MFKTRNNGVFSVDHPCSGRRMMGYPLQGIRLVPIGTRAKVRVRILHKRFQIGLVKCFDPCGQRAVTQNENRGAEFAGDPRSFERDVEAILDRGSRKHNPWAVAVAAENRLVKIALFHIGRKTCARSPRWTFITMSGISAIDAQPIASVLSEMPGPALPVTAR